jgi:hypothetical protein
VLHEKVFIFINSQVLMQFMKEHDMSTLAVISVVTKHCRHKKKLLNSKAFRFGNIVHGNELLMVFQFAMKRVRQVGQVLLKHDSKLCYEKTPIPDDFRTHISSINTRENGLFRFSSVIIDVNRFEKSR